MKYTLIILLLIIVMIAVLILGVIRADKICREANLDNERNYRFCLGI